MKMFIFPTVYALAAYTHAIDSLKKCPDYTGNQYRRRYVSLRRH